ncbi:MAG: hypothetical protein OSB41_11975, partial [Kiritimatiellae bacterium]|nr:hypothetical protein [Kiritimatiellia bacterium]
RVCQFHHPSGKAMNLKYGGECCKNRIALGPFCITTPIAYMVWNIWRRAAESVLACFNMFRQREIDIFR